MGTVAKLDDDGRLIGIEDIPDDQIAGRVVVDPGIDLPVDGSYWWDPDANTFMALSQIAALLPSEPPVPPDYVMFLALRSLISGTPFPDEVNQYVAWYEAAGEDASGPQRGQQRRAMSEALKALVHGDPMPSIVHEFVDWYDRHERPRAELRARRVKRVLQAPRR
jgi:hypothetical protein